MNLEEFPSNETAQNMLNTISSGFYDSSYIGKWLFQVMGMELEDAKKIFEELPFQVFPETASWGISYHEQKFGILVNDKLPLQKRRTEILRRRDIRAPMNPERISQIVAGISGTDVHVSENVNPYTFGITLVLKDDTKDVSYEDIRRMVRRVKPSHLSFIMDGGSNIKVELNIIYDSSLVVNSEFYPRFNIPPLLLNGLFYLDGKYMMGGYATQNPIDLYPMILTMKSQICGSKNPSSLLNISSGYSERINSKIYPVIRAPCLINKELELNCYLFSWIEHREVLQNEILLYGSFNEEMAVESKQLIISDQLRTMVESNRSLFLLSQSIEKIQIQAELCVVNEMLCESIYTLRQDIKSDVSNGSRIQSMQIVDSECEMEIGYNSKLTVEKDLWCLDGSSTLDGSHGLDPQVYDFKI